MTRPSSLPPRPIVAPSVATSTQTTPVDRAPAEAKSAQTVASEEPERELTLLADLLSARGLLPTIALQNIGSDPAVVPPNVEAPHPDNRGVTLAHSFFSQAAPSLDGSTLPIVFEGSAHTYAMASEASKYGFRPFVTGALTTPMNPVVSREVQEQAMATLPGYEAGRTPLVALDLSAPPLLVISDFHFASYKMQLPSADELKKRGITTVKVGLENEDYGARLIDDYVERGQPAQRAMALYLKAYEADGLRVELYGLDPPREVSATGERPWQTTLLRRLAWEEGVGGPPTTFDPTSENRTMLVAFLDRLTAKYTALGPGFAAQVARIAQAKCQVEQR